MIWTRGNRSEEAIFSVISEAVETKNPDGKISVEKGFPEQRIHDNPHNIVLRDKVRKDAVQHVDEGPRGRPCEQVSLSVVSAFRHCTFYGVDFRGQPGEDGRMGVVTSSVMHE